MVRVIDTFKARAQLGRLVDEARYRGDTTIIQKNGQPAAALVPLDVLESQKRARQSFMEALDEFQAGVQTDLSEAEVGALIDREVAAVRRERYERERAKGRRTKSHRGVSKPRRSKS